MSTCSTVKSSDEEINKPNSFVSPSPSPTLQKLEVKGVTFYMYAENYAEKEGWIGALGKAMIKPTVLIEDNFDNDYM